MTTAPPEYVTPQAIGAVQSLAFVSTTTYAFSDRDLEQLFCQMTALNIADDIGGVLLYSDCSVVQCIEGTPAAVGRAFGRIRSSTRHKDIMVLMDQRVAQRSFSIWNMGLVTAAKSEIVAVATADWKVRLNSAESIGPSPPGLALMREIWGAWNHQ